MFSIIRLARITDKFRLAVFRRMGSGEFIADKAGLQMSKAGSRTRPALSLQIDYGTGFALSKNIYRQGA
jgi:hypothetical protein